MKKSVLFLVGIVLSITIFSQVPQSFNYQAVLRDGSGPLSTNKKVSVAVIVGILQGSANGQEVFNEIHSTSTNDVGLFSIQIGSINQDDFVTIDWSEGPYFLKINVNGTEFGTTQLLSVPYSLHSKSAESAENIEYNNISNVPSEFTPSAHSHTESEISDLVHYSDSDIGGDENAFSGWDKDGSDDFDGNYTSLANPPNNLSEFINDVGFITSEIDDDITNEIQDLTISNDSLHLTNSASVKLPSSGPQFISKINYQIGGMSSPYTIDITQDLPEDCIALICTVEFLNRWTVSHYGGCYFEAYYGNLTADERIRIETPIENTNNDNYYIQSGPIRMMMTVPVINGDSIVLKHIGVKTLEVNGYYR